MERLEVSHYEQNAKGAEDNWLTYPISFIPQRHDWIDMCSAPRREVACEQGNHHQERRNPREGQRVRRLYTI